MLRSVAEISVLTGLSKVSIYNKLKLKDMDKFLIKNKGITYVSDDGLSLILDGLNLKTNDLNNEIDEVATSVENEEFQEFKDLKKEYINTLKLEIENLKTQIEEKDIQIKELLSLNKNNQILLKQQQDKEINQFYLEEHFKEVDNKLSELKVNMEKKVNFNYKNKGILKIIQKYLYCTNKGDDCK